MLVRLEFNYVMFCVTAVVDSGHASSCQSIVSLKMRYGSTEQVMMMELTSLYSVVITASVT